MKRVLIILFVCVICTLILAQVPVRRNRNENNVPAKETQITQKRTVKSNNRSKKVVRTQRNKKVNSEDKSYPGKLSVKEKNGEELIDEKNNKVDSCSSNCGEVCLDTDSLPSPEKLRYSIDSDVVLPDSESEKARYGVSCRLNEHEYVDLGLPSGVKWATCNLGASTPAESGHYYAWGELAGNFDFDASKSWTFGIKNSKLRSSGVLSTNGTLSESGDAVTIWWGKGWRMPSKDEYSELIELCEWEWIEMDNRKGFKIMGPNGSSIFLPASGWRLSESQYRIDEIGCYWSSSPNIDATTAYCLDFCFSEIRNLPEIGITVRDRFDGLTIRGVTDFVADLMCP